MLQLQPYLEEWRERGFDAYFVTLANSARTAVPYRASAAYPGLPLFHDGARAMIKVYGVSGVPTTVVVDGDGTVQDVKVGWGSGSLSSLTALIDRLCPE